MIADPHGEPTMVTRRTFHVRHADSDVAGLVEEILAVLGSGTNVVDLSRHDQRGTTIDLRTNEAKE
jgi:hypothetical protein